MRGSVGFVCMEFSYSGLGLYDVAANCGGSCGRSTLERIRIIIVIGRDNKAHEDNDFEEHNCFATTTSTGI
jgi:hypothetical protein